MNHKGLDHSEKFVESAQKLVERIRKADEVNAFEIDASFRAVMERVKKENRTLFYRYIYWWVSSAAVIVGITLVFFGDAKSSIETTELDMALLNDTVSTVASEVTLIANDATMSLMDDTSLKYDQTGASNVRSYILSKANKVANIDNKMHQIVVPKGKRANITLADGTKVYINSGTKVIYPSIFNTNKREILVEGEVYLEVAKKSDCPFVVKTRSFDVQVLGTAFDLCAYREDASASVVLVQGSVEITTGNKDKIELKPNQLIDIRGNLTSVYQVDVSEYISWKDNLLLIESKSADEIFNKLERYYGCRIECSKEIAAMTFSGKLDLQSSITEVMDNLCLLLSLSYSINDKKEICLKFK